MPLLPMTTTEHLPVWDMNVSSAWLVSGRAATLKDALEVMSDLARQSGASAVIGVSVFWTTEYVCVGTAVTVH